MHNWQWMKTDHNSWPGAFGSGELKKSKNKIINLLKDNLNSSLSTSRTVYEHQWLNCSQIAHFWREKEYPRKHIAQGSFWKYSRNFQEQHNTITVVLNMLIYYSWSIFPNRSILNVHTHIKNSSWTALKYLSLCRFFTSPWSYSGGAYFSPLPSHPINTWHGIYL